MSSIDQQVQHYLDDLGATFKVIPIDPAFTHTADFCAHYGFAPDNSGNAILVASRRPPGHNAVCLVKATTRLDVNRRVRGLLGVRKVSFASAEMTSELTGMEVGGVTPFALPDHLPIFVDSRVMSLDEVLVGGGGRSTKILVNPEVFARMESVQVIDDLALPIPAPSSGTSA